MKRQNLYLLLLIIWPFLEYWVYALLSFISCNFQFRITDYGYFLHALTCLTLEIYLIFLYKKNIKVKIFIAIHFIIFIVLFFVLVFNNTFSNVFKDLPKPCSINVINKLK